MFVVLSQRPLVIPRLLPARRSGVPSSSARGRGHAVAAWRRPAEASHDPPPLRSSHQLPIDAL